jgi:urea transport system substrate-binding protein
MGLTAGLSLTTSVLADDTVKVGILHSLSGTMAISETSLRDVLLYAFDEINTAGGIKVGDKSYKIEPVVVDGASNWPLFAEKAKQLLEEDKVAVTFGCWTSVSRKSVLPVFEKDNGLCSTPCNTRARNCPRTSSTRRRRSTSRPRRPWIICSPRAKRNST